MLKRSLIPLLIAPGCLQARDSVRAKPTPAPKAQAVRAAASGEKPPKNLSLKEAESIALRQAPVLGSAYFNALAANDVVKEVRSQFFPQIEGDVTAVGTSNAIRNAFGGTNHTVPPIRVGASGALNNPTILSRESQGFNISQLIFDFGRTANLTAAARLDALSQAQKTDLIRAQSFTGSTELI
jgi:outer membrane protein